MNPELPSNPREELELRVTALLLGELSEADAVSVREAIAIDPELQKLHDDLKQTIHLVREATVSAGESAHEESAPLKLSEERRKSLMTAFIIPPLKPEHVLKRPEFRRRLVGALAVVLLVGFLSAVLLPGFNRARKTSASNSIQNNLRLLDSAKQQWLLEHPTTTVVVGPTVEDLKPYLGRGESGEWLESIAGEKYVVGKIDEPVVAVVDGRKVTLPDEGTDVRMAVEKEQLYAKTSKSVAKGGSDLRFRTWGSDNGERAAVASSVDPETSRAIVISDDASADSVKKVEGDLSRAAKGTPSKPWNVSTTLRGFYDDNHAATTPSPSAPPAPVQSVTLGVEPKIAPPPTEIVLPKAGDGNEGDKLIAQNGSVAANDFFGPNSDEGGGQGGGGGGGRNAGENSAGSQPRGVVTRSPVWSSQRAEQNNISDAIDESGHGTHVAGSGAVASDLGTLQKALSSTTISGYADTSVEWGMKSAKGLSEDEDRKAKQDGLTLNFSNTDAPQNRGEEFAGRFKSFNEATPAFQLYGSLSTELKPAPAAPGSAGKSEVASRRSLAATSDFSIAANDADHDGVKANVVAGDRTAEAFGDVPAQQQFYRMTEGGAPIAAATPTRKPAQELNKFGTGTDRLEGSAAETTPQVNVHAKFAEVAQNDKRALGFDWYLGNTLKDKNSGGAITAIGGTAPSYAGAPSAANPSGIFPGTQPASQYSDKVPVLGDQPMVGQLFRSQATLAPALGPVTIDGKKYEREFVGYDDPGGFAPQAQSGGNNTSAGLPITAALPLPHYRLKLVEEPKASGPSNVYSMNVVGYVNANLNGPSQIVAQPVTNFVAGSFDIAQESPLKLTDGGNQFVSRFAFETTPTDSESLSRGKRESNIVLPSTDVPATGGKPQVYGFDVANNEQLEAKQTGDDLFAKQVAAPKPELFELQLPGVGQIARNLEVRKPATPSAPDSLLTAGLRNQSRIGTQGGTAPSREAPDVSQQQRHEASQSVQEGKALFELGKYDEAEAKMKEALKAEPGNFAAAYYSSLVKEQRDANSTPDRAIQSKDRILQVEKAWDMPTSRDRLPVPNPYAQTNLVPPSGQHQEIAGNVETASLYTRTFKVDPNTFWMGLQNVEGISFGEGQTASGGGGSPSRAIIPRVSVAGGGSRGGGGQTSGGLFAGATAAGTNGAQGSGGGLPFITQQGSVAVVQQATRNFFQSVGVDLNTPGKSVYFNDRQGTLIVRGTLDDLGVVDQAVQVLNTVPPQVNVAAKFGQTAASTNVIDAPLPRKPATNAPVAQPEIQTSENNFSTFSLNVSDVSFKLAAASLEKGQMPDSASIRSEEFINAFDYRDPEAAAGSPVAFAWERARYPFAHNRDLLRFSLKTAAAGRQAGRPLNIVLLLDNSGSMERADRVGIIREALRVLAKQLQPQDKLSVITFARTPRLVADGVAGDKASEVTERVSGLTPEGGTNLEDAMNLGYRTAAKHFLANGINRVVVLTDGAANLGDVEPESLKQKVEGQRKQGIALDCFGIGWDGFNDDLLEVLSRNGDGRYGFINSPEEAASEFAGQLAGALKVAASDVKVQVEFNPKRVTSYRQIGYAKHQLTKEQFRDNTVDAAEIAAQEAGNALYTVEVNPAGEGALATVHVRYKIPGTTNYREQAWDVPFNGNAVALEQSSAAMRLATTASAFSEWLAVNPHAGEVTPDALLNYLSGVPEVFGADSRPKKLEWMIRQAKSLEGK